MLGMSTIGRRVLQLRLRSGSLFKDQQRTTVKWTPLYPQRTNHKIQHYDRLMFKSMLTSTAATGDKNEGNTRQKHKNHNGQSGKKRITKLKKGRVTPDEPNIFDGDGVCAAYCVNNAVSFRHLTKHVKSAKFVARKGGIHVRYETETLKQLSHDVVHLILRRATASSTTTDQQKHSSDDKSDGLTANGHDDEDGHIFLFRSGAFVLWGVPLDIRRHMFDLMLRCQHIDDGTVGSKERTKHHYQQMATPTTMHSNNNSNNTSTRHEHATGHNNQLDMKHFEHEFKYSILETQPFSTFRDDEIVIAGSATTSESDYTANLLACSYGLAQSVRLLIYEEVVDSLIVRTQRLPNELAKHGHVNLSHRDLKRLIGELLAAKYSLNLVSDILDTPEYFWSNPDLERLHFECITQVELQQRSKILDARTEVIKDALAILNNELSASSSDRVERAILFLIGVEVAIEVVKAVQI